MRVLWTLLLSLAVSATALAQATTNSPQIPNVIRYSGTLSLADRTATTVGMTFALYANPSGGTPLWLETQSVAVGAEGNYAVVLGSASKDGIPAELFVSNEARWLGVTIEGQDEQPRALLVSVPYALKAGDAETLGGLPLSAFVLSAPVAGGTPSDTHITTSTFSSAAPTLNSTTGVANYVAKFLNTTDLGNSLIYDDGTNIGINTNTPQATLDVNAGGGSVVFRAFAAQFVSPTNNGPQFAFANNASPSPAQWRFGIPGYANATSFFIYDLVNQTAPLTIEKGAGADSIYLKAGGNVGIGTQTPNNKLSVAGTIESTSGGFKFPDGSTLTSAINQGTSTFTGNTINQILAVTQTGTGTAANFVAQGTGSSAANFTASNSTQTIKAAQNGPGVPQFSSSGVPAAVRGDATTNTGSAAGIFGTSSSSLGYGVAGANNAASCDPSDSGCYAIGMFGFSGVNGLNGTGVWGEAEAPSGKSVGVFGKSLADQGTGVYGYASSTANDSDATGVYGYSNAVNGVGIFGQVDSPTGAPAAVYGFVPAGNGIGALFDVQTGSNLMIGRSGTGSNTKAFSTVFRIDSTGKGYFNNGTQTGGADFAESVSVNGSFSLYHPGDLLIVDETGNRRFALANKAYSTKVAGIYSTKPGVLATPHRDGDPKLEQEVPLAIVGIVPCKVTAENGAIKAGDLLVASSRPGYAMKGTDRKRMLGAVVGKALGSLDKGTGVIEVLVSLH